MNNPVTTHDSILAQCRRLVMEGGLQAVNMRAVAEACQVALGSLYNYLPSKSALIAATVESVWNDIFYDREEPPRFASFLEAVRWFHESLARSRVTYPGFFTLHAMSFAAQDKETGRQLMLQHFGRIRGRLQTALEQDSAVAPEALAGPLTAQGVVELVFTTVIAMTLQGEGDIRTLLGLLKRALYKQ